MTTPFRPRWYFFVALVSITFIGPLSIHMFIPAIPAVKDAFGVSTGTAQLTLSLAMLSMAFVTVAYGGLSDRFGRKRVLMFGLVLFTAGVAVCLLAHNISMLIVGRVLQGAGAGCGVVLARAIARDVYGLERAAEVIAYLTAAYVLGPMIAPPIGGKLTDLFGWRAMFVFATVVAVLILVGAAAIIPETHVRSARSMKTGMIAGYRLLFRKLRFVGLMLQPGLMSGAFFTQATAASFLAIEVLKADAAEVGLWFFTFPAGYMIGNFISGWIGNRRSIEFMVMAGGWFGVATAAMLVGWLAIGGLSMPALYIPGIFIGIAQGIAMPYAQAGAMAVEPDLAGSASGAVVFSQFFWPAALQELAGLLADGTWRPMGVIYVVALVGALIAGWVGLRAKAPEPSG